MSTGGEARVDPDAVGFLVRAAREFLRGGWVFSGFHWPVLAGQTAARLDPTAFAQIFEAGATSHGAAPALPTSTTDYHALSSTFGWTGTTAMVLPALVRRAARVVLDAPTVDLRGQVNTTAVGPYDQPHLRLPGGGGAADAAGAARELVLLHGGTAPGRITHKVEHVTAAPRPGAPVHLLTRWGTLRLDGRPRLIEIAAAARGAAEAVAHFESLGVAVSSLLPVEPPSAEEHAAAETVLRVAADRGYSVARKAFAVSKAQPNRP